VSGRRPRVGPAGTVPVRSPYVLTAATTHSPILRETSTHLPVGGNRKTHISVHLQYEPPAGQPGALVATVLGTEPARMIREDLQRLKRLFEADARETYSTGVGVTAHKLDSVADGVLNPTESDMLLKGLP
jgi:hypothetical protein